MSTFIEGTFLDDEQANEILDYNLYPVSKKPGQTTKLFNQLIEALTLEKQSIGNFMTKSSDGSSISTALNAKASLSGATFTGTVNGITKSMVGLANVDNVSDANKSISNATQTALDAKASLSGCTFTGTVNGITKTMVGLSNVDNVSDANKSISNATQTALDGKSDKTLANTFTQLNTFQNYAPLCSVAPTTNFMLANKKYIDDNFLTLNSTQSISGTKTFNNIVITSNETNTGNLTVGDSTSDLFTLNSTTSVNGVNLTPTQISKLQYLDVSSSVSNLINAKTTLSAVQSNNNVFSGTTSFDNSLPTSILTPSSSNQLITKAYCDAQISSLVNSSPENLNTLNELSNAIAGDANFSTTMTNLIGTKAGLTTANTFTNTNTFNSLPITATELTPSDNKHLTPKKWCDDTFVKLGSNNTLTGVQNFNNNVIVGDGVGADVMTINCNISTNGNTVTPANLARVRWLSNITSDVNTNINSRASLASSNTFTNTNTFSSLPLIASDLTPDIDTQLIPLKFANDTYSKLGSNNTYTGTQNFNGNVVVGDHISDVLTLNSTISSNSVNITPTQLSKVQYLDISSSLTSQLTEKAGENRTNNFGGINTFGGDNALVRINCNLITDNKTIPPSTLGKVEHLSSVSSNVQDQINSKTTLSSVLGGTNTFTNQNTFSGVSVFNNDISARDLFLYGSSSNRSVQWINSNNSNNIGLIEGDITGEYLKLTSKNDLEFVNQSNQLVGKINKDGTPTDNKDVVLVETLNKTIAKPTFFCIGKSAESVSPLNIDAGLVYINSTGDRKIQNVMVNISYFVHTSVGNSLSSTSDPTIIRYNAIIGISLNKSNLSNITIRSYTVQGNTQMMSSNTGGGMIGYQPIVVGRVGERIAIQYNWRTTNWNNITTTAWVSGMFCSMQLLGSYTNNNPFLYPNASNSDNSFVGDAWFSTT